MAWPFLRDGVDATDVGGSPVTVQQLIRTFPGQRRRTSSINLFGSTILMDALRNEGFRWLNKVVCFERHIFFLFGHAGFFDSATALPSILFRPSFVAIATLSSHFGGCLLCVSRCSSRQSVSHKFVLNNRMFSIHVQPMPSPRKVFERLDQPHSLSLSIRALPRFQLENTDFEDLHTICSTIETTNMCIASQVSGAPLTPPSLAADERSCWGRRYHTR